MTNTINRLIIAQILRTPNFSGPIFALFLLAKGLHVEQILSLTSVALVSTMIFEIPTGVFADAYGRKWSMVIGALITVIAWIAWLFVDSFLGFAALYVLFGLANAFWSGADQALIYDELKSIGREHDAQKVFSRYSGILAGAFALAALVGGIIAYTHTLALFYLLFKMTLATSIAGFLVTLTIREPQHTSKGEEAIHAPQTMLRKFGAGIRLLKKNKKLLTITIFSVLTLSFALMDLYQLYFMRANVPPHWYGFALSLSALLVAIAKWNAHKLERWLGIEASMAVVTLVLVLLLIAIAFFVTPLAAVALFLLTDTFGNIREPIITDYLNRHIDDKNRATALSTISLIANGYVAVMLPIVGFIAGKNMSLAFLFCAAIIACGFLLFRIRADDVLHDA